MMNKRLFYKPIQLMLICALIFSGFLPTSMLGLQRNSMYDAQASQVNHGIEVGDYVRFGKYYDEPIMWRVISKDADGNPLLFADRILSFKSFDAAGDYHADNDTRRKTGSNYYRDSNLRQWLNSESSNLIADPIDWVQNDPMAGYVSGGQNGYHTEAGFLSLRNFIPAERGLIKPFSHNIAVSEVDANQGRVSGGTAPHMLNTDISAVIQNYESNAYVQTVTDRVFLLSVKQLKDWVHDRNWELRGKPTAKAIANSPFKNVPQINENSFWRYWLNTAQATHPSNVRALTPYGEVGIDAAFADYQGVRPALQLDGSLILVNGGSGTADQPYVIRNSADNDTTPPTPPTVISAANVKATSLTLSWGGATDNTGIAAYELYSGANLIAVVDNNQTRAGGVTFQISDLSPGTVYNFTIKSIDEFDNVSSSSETYTVTTKGAPTDMALSSNSVVENSPAGTVVGELSSVDADPGDTFTYRLVTGTGSTDNDSFYLVDNILHTQANFDFESKTTFSIRVRSTDSEGLTFDKVFSIQVTDEPETNDILISSNTVPENSPFNRTVGALSASGTGSATGNTFSLVAGVGDTDNFLFNISGTNLISRFPFDFETQSVYSIRLRVTNTSTGLSFSKPLSIRVTNVNESPSMSEIDNRVMTEDTPLEFMVTASDIDGTTPVISVTGGSPTTVSGSIKNGNILVLTPAANYNTTAPITFEVRASDGTFTTLQAFDVTVTAVNDVPVAMSANPVFNEDNIQSGTLVASDVENSPLIYSIITQPTKGTLTFNATTGAYSYAPNANVNGIDEFSFRVFDGELNSQIAGVKLNITPVNDAPTDMALSAASINENAGTGAEVGTLSATDIDSQSFSYTFVSGTGAADNSSFSIRDDKLSAAENFNFESKSSYSIRIRVSDGDLTYDKVFTITINDVNEAATDIALSNDSINENEAVNTLIGTFSNNDPDANNVFTYTLDEESAELFTIDGNKLLAGVAFDHEEDDSYTVDVKVSDGTLSYTESFTILINDLNEAPTSITLSTDKIAENKGENQTVAELDAEDQDANSSFTYSLVSGTGSDDNNTFSITEDKLTALESFDFETKNSYLIRIEVSDGQLTYQQAFTVRVTNVNEAPTDISLSSTSIAENAGNNQPVGTFSTEDVDANSVFTYSLVTGTGSTDNASFSISGNTLNANQSFNYEAKTSYSILVRVSDGALTYDESFTITVTDINEVATDMSLSETIIAENQPTNTTVGTFSNNDPDSSDAYNYTLVSGSGAGDNSSFNISGNSLRINAPFDFETKTSYSIRVQVSDGTLSFAKTFTITVTNVNEAPTTLSLSSNTLTENAGVDAVVGTLSATDPDAGTTYSYSLVSGTDSTGNSSFNISGNQLRANNSLDFETQSSYSVRVSVSDGSLSLEKVFVINVTNLNESATDITLSSTSIAENATVNTVVGTLSNNDPDASSTFAYTFINGEGSTDNSQFNINGNQLRSSATFDFETKTSYSVRIQVSDGTLTFAKAFSVNVTNVNEAPTDIALSVTSIAENATANTTVGTLTATDVDANSAFTYTLVSGSGDSDNGQFNISGNSLRATSPFNFETKSNYSVRIQVSDGALTFAKSFAITVTDVNEAATDITLSSSSIAENAAANSNVGTLGNNDPDAGNTFTYSLVTGTGSTDNASFSISGATLSANSSFNFETKSSYSIRIAVTDGSLSFDKAFTITVTNVNEAATDITLSASSVAENAAANTVVGTLGNNDPDAGNTFAYSLVAGTGDTDNGSFNISGTGLRINGPFDFETKNSYSVRVQVSDGSLTFAEAFAITVTNVNEAPTDITLSATSIDENAGANATVGALSAADPDAGNTFTYTLVTGIGSTDNASFNIDALNLRATNSFNFETKSSYSVRVRATDQGGLTFEKVFAITVTNVNEAATDITLSAGSVAENAAVDTVVGTLTNNDPDAGSTFTYSLVSGSGSTDNDAFNINGNQLRASNPFNFEIKSSYAVRIQVSDGALTFEKAFTITVTNVNEAPTDLTLSATSIAENAAANTTVGTLSATDVDASSTFTFALVAGEGSTDNSNFNILGTALRATSAFNFETKSSYSIRVRATDQGSLTYEEAFTITVNDVNEAATDITLSATVIAENAGAGATVGTLTNNDPDDRSTFTYTLVTGTGSTDNASFSISGDTLSANSSFNFEAKSSYAIRIQVSDGALTFAKAFTITVTNVNEAATDITLSASSVAENAAANTSVGTFTNNDPDSGTTPTYSFVTGTGDTDNGAFNISGNSLRINAPFDFETKNSYSIRVQVSDGSLSFEKTFTITVTNVNEAPTDITLTSTSIAENAGANGVVGTLGIVDQDASNTHTYTLVLGVGSTDNASFNISGTNLRATASLNFETKSSYSIRVRATDQGSLTFEKVFAITVTNVNEAATTISLSATSIAENSGANAVIGNLTNNDPDVGDTFTYSLVSGTGDTDNGSFNMNGNQLRANASFDFETKTGYAIRVQVSDGSLTFARTFTINVTNSNETPTDITLSNSSLAENGASNATVGTLTTTDPDVGNTFTYSLVSGSGSTDNASFSLAGNSLRAAATFDFETKNSYAIRIRTSDGSLTFEKEFTINITNVNEAPTNVLLSNNILPENNELNAVIGNLSGTDPDANTAFTYSLVIGTGSTDNSSFNIADNQLQAASAFNFENKSSYSIRVRASDGALHFERAFTISVTDVAEAATDIMLSANSIDENAGDRVTVGTLTNNDQDAGDTFSYSLVDGDGAEDNERFAIDGETLIANSSFDFEEKSQFNVRIEVTDGSLSFEKSFVIQVTDVSETPGEITLSPASINENAGANAEVGTLNAVDPDVDSILTFSFASGTGDTDNAAFSINGDKLIAKNSFNYEQKSSYTVRIQVTDGTFTVVQAFTIEINNVNEKPSLTAIDNQVMAEDEPRAVTLTFSDPDETTPDVEVSGGSAETVSASIEGNILTLTPAPNYNTQTPITFTVTVSDGELSDSKTFTVIVNPELDPIVAEDLQLEVTEDEAQEGQILVDNFDNRTLSYHIVTNPSKGSITKFEGDTGKFIYMPNGEFSGNDQFTFRVFDGFTYSNTAVMKITVKAVDDKPLIYGPDQQIAFSEKVRALPALTVADIDSAALKVKIIAASGNLAVTDTEGVTAEGVNSKELNLTGSVTALNAALKKLTYLSDTGFVGNDPLQITVSDNTSTEKYKVIFSEKFYNPENGRYYEYVSSPLITWTDARLAASSRSVLGLKGYLATITDEQENEFVQEILKGRAAWIGLTDQAVEGTFRWIDGPEAGQLPVFTNWNEGEPNNQQPSSGGEDYVHFIGNTSGLWNDLMNRASSQTGFYGVAGFLIEYGGQGFGGEPVIPDTLTVVVKEKDLEPPVTPFRVFYSQLTDTGMVLNWRYSVSLNDSNRQKIFMNGQLVQELSGTVTSYAFNKLRPDTSYRFEIVVEDLAGNVAPSTPALIVRTPKDITLPTVPSNITLVDSDDSSLNLRWNASSDNDQVDRYIIEEVFITFDLTGNEIRTYNKVGEVTDRTFTYDNLTFDSTYTLVIRSVDASGNMSARSPESNFATKPDQTPPTIPDELKTGVIGHTKFELLWDLSTDNQKVYGYEIFVDEVNVGFTSDTKFVVDSVFPSKTYNVQIRSMDSAYNVSELSEPIEVSTLQDTKAPSAPTRLAATEVTSTSIRIGWKEAADDILLSHYEIRVNNAVVDTTKLLAYRLTGFTPRTTYTIEVVAIDSAGNRSIASNVLNTATTADRTPPTIPTVTEAVDVTRTGFVLKWTESTDNVAVKEYEVLRNGVAIGRTSALELKVEGLSLNRTYRMSVVAYDIFGNESKPSNVLLVKTLADDVAPQPPTELKASAIGLDRFNLSWQPAVDDVGVVKYEVYVGDVLMAMNVITKNVLATSASVRPVRPGTVHTVTVIAYDAMNNVSVRSETLEVRTLDDTLAPLTVTGLTADGISTNRFLLRWDAAVDNVRIAGYEVFRNGESLAKTTERRLEIVGLDPNTTYDMTVVAYDETGLASPNTNVLKVKTLVEGAIAGPALTFVSLSNAVTRSSTVISYRLSTSANVTIRVYNSSGVLRATPVRNLSLRAGLNKNNISLGALGSGEYLIEITARNSAAGESVLLREVVMDATGPVISNLVTNFVTDEQTPSGRAILNYTLSERANAVVTVLTGSGSTISTFTIRGLLYPGQHTFVWEPKTRGGKLLPDGDYIFRIDAQDPLRNRAARKQIRFKVQRPVVANPPITGVRSGTR